MYSRLIYGKGGPSRFQERGQGWPFLTFFEISYWFAGGMNLTLSYCMSQIDHHFCTFLVTDVTIEKLQKLATTHVDAHFKARWLRWWNSPLDVKDKNKFPTALPLRERVLENWLTKASFWAQVHLQLFLSICSFL